MDIDKLEGRELDRRIAEHLGYQDMQTSPDPDTLLYTCKVNASTGERYTLYPDVPHWHRDIAAAWGLVEEIRKERDMFYEMGCDAAGHYCVFIPRVDTLAWPMGGGDSLPTAIARAYLKAKESQ